MDIYLDIDGVLLTKYKQPANHVKEFLEYVTEKYSTYWLTTHCKGDAEYTINQISQYFDDQVLAVMKKIKPTNWNLSKTEAIDFSRSFLWFDDYIFDFEKVELIKTNALKNWVLVDLVKNPDQLMYLIDNFPA